MPEPVAPVGCGGEVGGAHAICKVYCDIAKCYEQFPFATKQCQQLLKRYQQATGNSDPPNCEVTP